MTAEEVSSLLVSHLGLTLVGGVELRDLQIVSEPHRGSRGVAAPGPESRTGRVVDLSHPIAEGMVTYPGLPAPSITPHLTRAASRERYAPGTEFAMDVITMIGNTGTYLDSPFHRYADGADLAALDLDTLVDLPAEVFHLRDAWTPERRGIRAATLADREHLTALDRLPARGARFTAAPPAIRGFGTFPVRAFATVPISH